MGGLLLPVIAERGSCQAEVVELSTAGPETASIQHDSAGGSFNLFRMHWQK